EDNGISWEVRKVAVSAASNSDPSVAIAKDGRVYLGYAHSDNYAVVAVSDDKGKTWDSRKIFDVGASFGIHNVAFPAMVAGDSNRAAFAFLGTTATGNIQDPNFPGIWHLYVAHTYDGGASWLTTDATPNDPVQRGCIWFLGGSNICRNLLDFMDVTVDKEGRVLVGYADGCAAGCTQAPAGATGNGYTSNAAIAQNGFGASCGSNEVTSVPLGSSCALPGIRVVTDATGDGAAVGSPALDIQSVSVAEPYGSDGSSKLVFTLKMTGLATLPPNA